MASLTTIDGTEFHFDPSALLAVADHAADSGEAVTTVYGLTAGWLETRERADGLLQRIGASGTFAKLTRPDGSAVWVNCKVVSVVRPSTEEEDPAAHAVVSVGTLNQAVKETTTQIAEAVNDRGGSL